MKGVINKGIQELVETKLGPETWQKIADKAGCEEPFFAIGENYPDQMTSSLSKAAMEVSGLPEEQALMEFGKYLIATTGKKAYPTYYSLVGTSPKEFLLNLDRMYKQLTHSMEPPLFSYDDHPDGRLTIHYQASRGGRCAVVKGLIQGVGSLFSQALQVKETACKDRGDAHCIMEVTFP